MGCAKCGAPLAEGLAFCSVCGAAQTSSATGPVGDPDRAELAFTGKPLQILGWYLLGLVSFFPLAIPLAWVTAAIGRWICRNLKFSDGTMAEFRGTGDQVVIWHVLYFVVLVIQVFLQSEAQDAGPGAILMIALAGTAVQLAIGVTLIRWFIYNVTLSHPEHGNGPDLRFEGSYLGLLGWQLILAISVYTIVGWAWIMPRAFGWFLSQVKAKGRVFTFHGPPVEILWRGFATVLGSLLIVTFPWLYCWFTKWWVSQIQMSYKDEMDISQLAD